MADWYASPTGNSGNSGTLGSPWDIGTALQAHSTIGPGDTLWLLEGTYFYPTRTVGTAGESGWQVTLQGTSGSPIEIRPYQNGRATIDGGIHSLSLPQRPEYLNIYNLEVIVSENLTETRTSTTSTTPPPDLVRPWGGMDMSAGLALKIIHCNIHHNMQGIGFWQPVDGNSELYGNIICDNGWIGTDRTHGHGIYTQNPTTTRKYIRNNILGRNYSFNFHAYTQSGLTDNLTVERNISYGVVDTTAAGIKNCLTGGRNSSSNTGFEVHHNRNWRSNLEFGYQAQVPSANITNNRVVMSKIETHNLVDSTFTDNFVWEELYSNGWTGVLKAAPNDGAATPSGPDVFIEPSTYDSSRAHVAIYNYFLDSEVSIDFGSFLSNNDPFYLLDPEDFYGLPVYSGTYQGSPLMVPTGGKMFVPLVAIQAEAQQPVSVPSSGFMW